MKVILSLLVALAVFHLINCQDVPIPSRYDGMSIGNPTAPILLEEFLDLQCMNCKHAHPTIKQLLAHYGPDKIYYIQHINPLDLHRQAWDAAKSAAVVNKYAPQHYWDYIDYVFANQAQFYDAAFFNKTEAQLYDLFATWGTQYGIKKELFVKEMSSDYAYSVVDMGRMFSVTRTVHYTPTFYINGVKATQVDTTTTLQQWIQLLGLTAVKAECGSDQETVVSGLAGGSLEYLYVDSPYNVTIEEGNEFVARFAGTDLGDVDLVVSGQQANMTLKETTVTPINNGPTSPRSQTPRPGRIVSTASNYSRSILQYFILAIGLGLVSVRVSFRGALILGVVLLAVSTVPLSASQSASSVQCPTATVTLVVPRGTVRFVCVNEDACVCGPGYAGNDCTETAAPTATPLDAPNTPLQAPLEAPVQAPTDAPVEAPVEAPVRSPVEAPVPAPTCTDSVKNGEETDVDCGGIACPQCMNGKGCTWDDDCQSMYCGANNICATATCTDTTKNGEETDMDCGGPICPQCPEGSTCSMNEDCTSNNCSDNTCEPALPTCDDLNKNGFETDVDCGGGSQSGCSPCDQGLSCLVNSDCTTSYCNPQNKCDVSIE